MDYLTLGAYPDYWKGYARSRLSPSIGYVETEGETHLGAMRSFWKNEAVLGAAQKDSEKC